jgi:N-dimethylarginine dimethylaminohydrolase
LSNNEWGSLKKVIVGIADDAIIPELDISLRTVNYADVLNEKNIPQGKYPQKVIDEANEDLNNFVYFLESIGIEVLRPDKKIKPSYYNYCPRDSVLIHKDLILACPQPLRARKNEYLAFESHLKELKGRFIVKEIERPDSLYNTDAIGNKDILALTEVEPSFDAANILRDNDNLYYLVSNGGNKKGLEYLKSVVSPKTKVWPIENVYSYMHIDSTIALLREGLMLLNPSRIKSIEQLPLPLRNWDIIWAPEPNDIGYYPGYCNASEWINMNLFSVSPDLVVLEEHQVELKKELKKYKIESEMLSCRHQRTLGGGFHCVTLDLIRNS